MANATKPSPTKSALPIGNGGGTFVSPLRYPGGKGRLGPWIASLMKENGLEGGCYVEPYAGGAGVAMYLLLRNHARQLELYEYGSGLAVSKEVKRFIETLNRTAAAEFDSLSAMEES